PDDAQRHPDADDHAAATAVRAQQPVRAAAVVRPGPAAAGGGGRRRGPRPPGLRPALRPAAHGDRVEAGRRVPRGGQDRPRARGPVAAVRAGAAGQQRVPFPRLRVSAVNTSQPILGPQALLSEVFFVVFPLVFLAFGIWFIWNSTNKKERRFNYFWTGFAVLIG